MASPLSVGNDSSNNLNDASPAPARGAEMRNFLQTRLQKNRAPPLVHAWEFYHDRQAKPPMPGNKEANDSSKQQPYTARLEHLASIPDVRAFWSVFNNFDLTALALRDSIHLFHRGVKPLWEDARNVAGGRWTFRIPRVHAQQAWTELALLAIGEQLQTAIEDPARVTFRDDICGISLSVRFNSVLVQVWNRDAGHEEGIRRVKEVVLEGLSAEYRPKGEASMYYKRHFEHGALEGETKNGETNGSG